MLAGELDTATRCSVEVRHLSAERRKGDVKARHREVGWEEPAERRARLPVFESDVRYAVGHGS